MEFKEVNSALEAHSTVIELKTEVILVKHALSKLEETQGHDYTFSHIIKQLDETAKELERVHMYNLGEKPLVA